jgi:Ca2+-binding EF-hand superfamily protein
MTKLVAALAFGAAFISTPVLAQSPGGGYMQHDQTRAEAQQRADMLFQTLDANKDGSVTRAEAAQALAQFEAARGGGDGGHGGGRMQRMIEQAFGSSPSLTLQQFEAQALTRFDERDLNKDGTVTAAERQQARGQQPSPQASPVKPQ